MTHIDGRRQRHLSKARGYKKKYGCNILYSGVPGFEGRSKSRRYLNQPVQQLRDFHCQLTDDCECPGCNFDDLYRHAAGLWDDGQCGCGGAGPLAAAVHQLNNTGRADEIEPLVRRLFGKNIEVSSESGCRGHSYTHFWIPSHRISLTARLDSPDPQSGV